MLGQDKETGCIRIRIKQIWMKYTPTVTYLMDTRVWRASNAAMTGAESARISRLSAVLVAAACSTPVTRYSRVGLTVTAPKQGPG